MNFVPKPSRSSGAAKPLRWDEIIPAHAENLRRYRQASDAAQGDPVHESEADNALHALLSLESQALRMPADSADAIRFKLSLWSDGRIEGFDEEWKIFVDDCERLLLNANDH